MNVYELANELEKPGTVDRTHLKEAANLLRAQAKGIELLLEFAKNIDESLGDLNETEDVAVD
jgi:hypothetical protein